MCLLCVSMMGVSAWADNTYTYQFNSKSWGAALDGDGVGNDWTSGKDGNQLTSGQGIQITTGVSGANGTSPISFSNVSKVVVKYCTNASKGDGTIKVKVGDGTEQSFSVTKPSSGGTTLKEATFTFSPTESGKVTVTGLCTTNSIYIHSVIITEASSDPSVSFETSSKAIAVGTTYTQTATTLNIGTSTVSYSSDNTAVATVNSTTGVVTGVSTGTATITASVTVSGTQYTDSYDVIVYAPITFNKVTNMNQLLAGNKYIIVCESQNKVMGAQENVNYRSSVDGTPESGSIVVDPTEVTILTLGGSADAWTFLASDNDKYMTLTSDNNNVQSADDAAGNGALWTVTDDFELINNAYSRTLRYNSSSPRFACYSSGQTAAVLYVKEGSAVAKNVADVAISTEALFVGETATVTTDGPAVTLSTSDASVVSVSGTTVTAEGAGTATITATWAESTEFQAGSKDFTITVLRVDGLSEAKAFTVAEARAMIDNGYDSEATYFVTGIISKVQSYNETYGSVTYWISDDGIATNQFECYGGLSFDGEGFTGKDNLTVGDEVTVKGKLNKYGSTYELNSDNELVYLRSTISVSASGYATYYNSGLAYVIPTGLTGYAITAAAGDQLTTTEYTAGIGVPAGEALVLKGAQGNYDLIFTTTDVTPNASNLLKGSDAAETPTADGKYYMLSYDATGANVGFYWGEDNGAAFENGAHKAYLLLPADTPVKGFRFDFDEATAITELTEKTEATEEVIYNLQGQQLSAPQRGINIIGGKKVLVK